MSEKEQAELNRRVAVSLGYTVVKDPASPWLCYLKPENNAGWIRTRATIEAAWEDCPNFCADPAATELVEAWFESEGWRLIQDFVPVCGGGKSWLIRAFKQDSIGKVEEESKVSRKVALCLAFLAAMNAQGEQG